MASRIWEKNTEPLVGITAPIGFEFTWGFRKKIASRTTKDHGYAIKDEDIKKLSGSNFGIMLQVLDIGAVFKYRLNDSESELPEEFTFKQVFSPGAAFHYGFRKTPITLSAGYQYTPELRK